jgi:hypothetical protein
MERLRSAFDIVLVDGGPIDGGPVDGRSPDESAGDGAGGRTLIDATGAAWLDGFVLVRDARPDGERARPDVASPPRAPVWQPPAELRLGIIDNFVRPNPEPCR